MQVDPNSDGVIRIIYVAISMIAFIPSIYIGYKLIYEIPFSTQVSPVGKWNWGIYIKVLIK